MDINLITPINPLGYGVAGLNILKNLYQENRVSLFPLGSVSFDNEIENAIVSECYKNAFKFSYDAPCVKIWHQNDMAQFVGRGRRIGFQFFELNKFNELEIHHLN